MLSLEENNGSCVIENVHFGKVAKGMKAILEEWGISTVGKNAEWMRNELAGHPDFRNEMNMVE